MPEVPAELHYAKSHEWVRHESDGSVIVGITDYAQQSLGDITYVQLPRAGTKLTAGTPFGVVELVKAASDLYAPITGSVAAANEALATAPDTVNRAPYAGGWLLRLVNTEEPPDLLTADEYRQLTS